MESISKNKFSHLAESFLLEQYKQSWNQRQREASIQIQLLGIGNTILLGLLISAFKVQDSLFSMLLSGAVIPVAFFLYITNRKHRYFEDLFSENIEAIEKKVGGIKHIQYDTYPQKNPSDHYFVKYPKKYALEKIIPESIMNTMLIIYTIAGHCMLYRYGIQVFEFKTIGVIMLGTLPVCYLSTFLIKSSVRLG